MMCSMALRRSFQQHYPLFTCSEETVLDLIAYRKMPTMTLLSAKVWSSLPSCAA